MAAQGGKASRRDKTRLGSCAIWESLHDAPAADRLIRTIALPCVSRRIEMGVHGKLDCHTSISLDLEAAVASPLASVGLSNEDRMDGHLHRDTSAILFFKAPVTPPFVSVRRQIGVVGNDNFDASEFARAEAPFTLPAFRSGAVRQKCVRWNLDQVTAHTALAITRQAFSTVIG